MQGLGSATILTVKRAEAVPPTSASYEASSVPHLPQRCRQTSLQYVQPSNEALSTLTTHL